MKSKKLILKGIAASTGIASGKVVIVYNHKDASKFNHGDVLVTKITDPSMIIMMSRAAAIVCDIGGIGSHPAIISREMGIPCVVNTKEATSMLKNGDEVEVDGKSGEIYFVN